MKQTYGYQMGRREKDTLEAQDYSTRNYVQYLIPYNGKESVKEYIHIKYITESLCCTSKTNTTLEIYTLIIIIIIHRLRKPMC